MGEVLCTPRAFPHRSCYASLQNIFHVLHLKQSAGSVNDLKAHQEHVIYAVFPFPDAFLLYRNEVVDVIRWDTNGR